MLCPRCGLPLDGYDGAACPRCGQVLDRGAPTAQGGTGAGPAEAQMPPAPPPWGYYPGQVSGAPPAGQAVPPPGYGWPSPQGPYTNPPPPPGYGAWPGYDAAPPLYPAAPAPAPRKAPIILIVALVAVLVIVVVGSLGLGAYAVANARRNVASELVLPTPTATPHDVIAVQDTLSSNNLGWTESSHCFFKDESFHIQNNWYCYLGAEYYDTRISVQAKQVSGPPNYPYGIVFRFSTVGTYYAFMIDSNGDWAAWKCTDDKCLRLRGYETSEMIHTGLGITNMLTLLTQGTHFEFFVNGERIGQADDNAITSGKIGLIAGENIEVAFSNLTIEVPAYN